MLLRRGEARVILYIRLCCHPPPLIAVQASVLRMGAVCRRWRLFVRDPAVWRALCVSAWPGDHAAASQIANEWGGWKSMLFSRPRLMIDGVYVQ
jgi:hypothetical protein